MAAIIQTVDGVVVNKFELEPADLTFGRASSNHVQIDDLKVSQQHAKIVCETTHDGRQVYLLEDLDSTNGSYVNEVKITRKPLYNRDVIRIGVNMFTFVDEEETDLKKTSEIKKSWIPGVYYSKD